MTSARSFANRYLQTDCSKGNDIKYIIFARMFRPLHDWWPIFDHCGYRINKWWFFIGLFTDCPSRTCREHLLVLRGLALELNRLRTFYLLLIGHLWMPEESVDLGYSCEWLAESALQIMMVLQETDLPPPALLGLQLSHYMDWFSSGHRRVLMHENYVQTNHAKDKTQSYVFFVRHHDLLKQRAILGFETTNQETGLKVPIFCLSPCAGTHPRIWLIQTSRLFSNFLLYVMLAVDMWFLRSIDICIFQCCHLLCSSDWHTNHTNTKTKGNQKKQEKEKDLLSQSVSLWLLFLFVWFRFCVVYCLLEYIYIYVYIFI